jgi:hypothetical protein
MSRRVYDLWALLLGAAGLVACSASQPSAAGKSAQTNVTNTSSSAAGGGASASHPSLSGTNTVIDAGSRQPAMMAGSSSVVPTNNTSAPPLNCNQLNSPFKVEGCPCTMGQTSACWTGPAADRNAGKCHDGLQVCEGTSEFASWGECKGEELSCGVDAGMPDTDEDCTCVPGAVIQCSEDCSVGIICSLTATKTCLPDGTWSTCREELGVALDAPGFQCRNMLHGCVTDALSPDGNTGAGELFVGDCSKQFKCGHPPPPPPPPVLPE